MILLTISEFFIYCSIAWGTNMLLNVLGIIKMYFPKVINFDKPIDGDLKYKTDRLVGESTTILGLILSIIISLIIYYISLSFIWASIPILVYIGHMTGSIIKRRMHKKGGEFVPFVDHGDYIVMTGIVFWSFEYITLSFFILSLALTYILHPIVCFLAFKLKIRERPY